MSASTLADRQTHSAAAGPEPRGNIMLDAERIRADFPILGQTNGRGQRLAYLDSAASAQKPAQVLDALDDYYRRYNANIHRGVYSLSELATNAYEAAREQV